MERLVFMNLSYNDAAKPSICNRSISTAFIYTMGRTLEQMELGNYEMDFQHHARYLKFLNGKTEYLVSNDTYQFDNYSDYATAAIDEVHKAKVKEEQFHLDCEKAFKLVVRLADI